MQIEDMAGAVKDLDIGYTISCLRSSAEITETEAEMMYEQLTAQVYTEEQVLEVGLSVMILCSLLTTQQFLSHLTGEGGGLESVAVGIFHNKVKIRSLTVRLLCQIENTEVRGETCLCLALIAAQRRLEQAWSRR
jgi:hypothetical protein